MAQTVTIATGYEAGDEVVAYQVLPWVSRGHAESHASAYGKQPRLLGQIKTMQNYPIGLNFSYISLSEKI